MCCVVFGGFIYVFKLDFTILIPIVFYKYDLIILVDIVLCVPYIQCVTTTVIRQKREKLDNFSITYGNLLPSSS